MTEQRVYVDFNEMVAEDIVLLSREDFVKDSCGNVLQLYEGMFIKVYMDDVDDRGNIDNLIAEGIVQLNIDKSDWSKHVKWCCKINGSGIRHESDN